MAQRRHHYERAFEEYLRSRRIPYVSVDEARKALVPPDQSQRAASAANSQSLKSFDFVIYGQDGNLLIDIKGRRVAPRGRMDHAGTGGARVTAAARSRLECWVTEDDIHSLTRWHALFGSDFTPAFVFVYWCVEQPPDALFQEIFEYRGRWYALRAVTLDAYRSAMKPRSLRWRTVDIPTAAFERISQPFAPAPSSARSARSLARHHAPSIDDPGRVLASLDDPIFSADLGPQLPALHPYTSPIYADDRS